ncbi:MAG TPA: hypothetical protein DCL21_00680, partial [Alphaproteobacteria bacterium]|nr:hypothetical protein [Alphaproteobacteria bacterium]
MIKNLLVLRNATALKTSDEFFKSQGLNFYSQSISYSENIDVNLASVETDIVLITSQNALKAVQQNLEFLKGKKVYCLNSQIAERFKEAGAVSLKWHNTKELAEYIINNEVKGQKIVHLCASNANKLFYKSLEKAGFVLKSINVYKTTFVTDFNNDITEALKSK